MGEGKKACKENVYENRGCVNKNKRVGRRWGRTGWGVGWGGGGVGDKKDSKFRSKKESSNI